MPFVIPRVSGFALAGVALVHGGIIAALMNTQPIATPPAAPALMVEILASTTAEPPKPRPSPSKPVPAVAPAAPSLTPAPIPTPAPAPLQAPVSATPAPSHSANGATAAPSPTPPAAVLAAPKFDADYLDNPAPSYPPLSRRTREEGKVVLRVFVEASGTPSTVEIRTSSGFERLDKSALAAVSRWKFVPAKQGAETVGAWVLVPIVFSLK